MIYVMFPRFSVTPCCKQISAANACARNVSPQILTISFQPRRAGLRSRIVHVFILPIHPSVFPLRSPICIPLFSASSRIVVITNRNNSGNRSTPILSFINSRTSSHVGFLSNPSIFASSSLNFRYAAKIEFSLEKR